MKNSNKNTVTLVLFLIYILSFFTIVSTNDNFNKDKEVGQLFNESNNDSEYLSLQ